MGPASHPSAQWESGKPESSLAENSPASPAQQSQNREVGGGPGLIPLAAQDGQDWGRGGAPACRTFSAAACAFRN